MNKPEGLIPSAFNRPQHSYSMTEGGLGGAERLENATVWRFQRGVSGSDMIGKPPSISARLKPQPLTAPSMIP